MDWEHLARVAPLATAGIAFFAACIALVSILIQKGLAKRRAAIDFTMKVMTDKEMLILRRELVPKIDHLDRSPSMAGR